MAQLEQLADLHSKGILTDEEFAAKKAQILGISTTTRIHCPVMTALRVWRGNEPARADRLTTSSSAWAC